MSHWGVISVALGLNPTDDCVGSIDDRFYIDLRC